MKVTEIKAKVTVLADMIKSENPAFKKQECYLIATAMLNNGILCNGLNKALPYGSDNYLSENCDI